MMQELESVVLTVDFPEHNLKVGDIGTIALVHGNGKGYEVEFVTLDGETLAVASVYAEQVHRFTRPLLPLHPQTTECKC
jgi:hypothetical protein